MTEINFSLLTAPLLPMMVIWVRVTSFLAFVPFFNAARTSAVMFKTALALVISVLIVNALPTANWQVPSHVLAFLIFLSGEVMVGILISLIVTTLFMILQILGHILGYQMAFSMAKMIDTTMGEQSDVISVMLVSIGTVILIAVGGDHLLIWSLYKSFEIVPPGHLLIGKDLLDFLVGFVTRSFELGVKVAFPGIILLLSVDLVLGLIGRTASKMQIFFVGLPLKISLGLYILIIGLGYVMAVWRREIAQIPQLIGQALDLMRT